MPTLQRKREPTKDQEHERERDRWRERERDLRKSQCKSHAQALKHCWSGVSVVFADLNHALCFGDRVIGESDRADEPLGNKFGAALQRIGDGMDSVGLVQVKHVDALCAECRERRRELPVKRMCAEIVVRCG